MRCLHCGSTLSAFKKLTDSDFCSTEHRDQFYTEQQRLIVERLKHSGARFHRLRRGGVGDSARPAAPAVPPVLEAQAPAKIAAYLSAVLDPLGRSLSLQFLPQIDPELVATNPPARQIRSGARQLLSGLIPDLLWPRYNPGLLSCVSFELADESSDIAYGSIFKLTALLAFGFTPASLTVLRRPDALNLPARAALAPRMMKPKPAISLGPVRLRVEVKKSALTGLGYRHFIDLAPIERPLPEAYLDASPIEISIGLGIPASLRLRSEQKARGLAFLDRVFRMRPRSGVLPSNLPGTRQMLLEPLPASVSPSRPRDISAATHYQPARIDRFIRTRPRGPVDFATASHDFKTTADIVALRPPHIPDIERKQSELAPAPAARPVRVILRVAASGNTEEIAISRALDFSTRPINPGLSGGVDCAPMLVDRFYRPRPRGPVSDDALPVSHESELTLNGFVSQPVIRELERPALAFEPGLSERIFRMRPRAGVAGESVADLIPSTTADQLMSSPATPRLVVLTETAPSLVTRMYRIRPSSGVGPDTAQKTESISAFPADVSLSPAVIGFVSPRTANFAPPLLDRLYRGRPKLGVPSSLAAEFSPAEGRPEQFASRPAIRSIGLGDCFPNVVIRLYRFRPKSAVDARTSSANLDTMPLDFPPDRPRFAPDWWDVVNGPKPLFVNRMYRMRLKQPAEDADTLTQTIRTRHLPIPDPEPVLATMPSPQVTASPSFLDRLYRMRPKSGKAPAPATNSIPCNALEPRPHSGAPTAVLQSVSKHWRATPLSIKSIAATIPLLLMLTFLPLGIPSSAADGKRVRDAIVRRAAIEQSDDFGEGFTNWQGVGKWKQKPSGMVEPVGLGLFKPSLELRDYRMTFSAQIVKQALGFVVRAKDDRNYQAIKLVTLKPGPLPTVAVVRYAVVDGKETSRNQIVLPMTVAADTVYRISLDVNGQSFTLMVQGKVVDFWSEEQLKSGGAGFFSAKGEQALIQNIRISHHDDAIGRLFAALALQNVQASDGSQPKR